MARIYKYLEQFNYGQLGKNLFGRGDQSFYDSGCKKLRNFKTSLQGPTIKRNGTTKLERFIANSFYPSKIKLIPFIFSENDSVLLVLENPFTPNGLLAGTDKISFIKNKDFIYEANQTSSGSDLEGVDPMVFNVTGHGFSTNDIVYLYDIEDPTGVASDNLGAKLDWNNQSYKVTKLTNDTFTLSNSEITLNGLQYVTAANQAIGGSNLKIMDEFKVKRKYQIDLTFDLPKDTNKIKYDQKGDIMYISTGESKPKKITRFADTNWTLEDLDYQLGPVQDFNETSTTITLSSNLTKGNNSVWTSSTSLFDSSDVGTVWAIAKHDDQTVIGYARMVTFNSVTSAEFTNQTNLTNVTTTATLNWKNPSWSDTFGWPKSVAFHEGRLYFAGTSSKPLGVWGSVSNAFENFDLDDGSADDALQFEIAANTNDIEWLLSDGSFLVCGTRGGLGFVEFQITSDVVTPRARVGAKYGSSNQQGLNLGNNIVYLQNSINSVYEASYNDINFKYDAINLNDLNSDLFSEKNSDSFGKFIVGSGNIAVDILADNKVKEMAIIEKPDTTILLVGENGLLYGITRDANQKIIGYYVYEFEGKRLYGNNDDISGNKARVVNIGVLPSEGEEDEIYLVIERENGTSSDEVVLTIETLSRTDSIFYYLDGISNTSYQEINGVGYIGGLIDFNNKQLSVYYSNIRTSDNSLNNKYVGEYTVENGRIAFDPPLSTGSNLFAGFKYTSDFETMPINIPIPQFDNSSQTLKKRINEIAITLYKTTTLEIGTTFEELQSIPFRNLDSVIGEGPAQFASQYPEVKIINFNGKWSRQNTICIRSELPFPATIVSMMLRMEIESQ